MTTELLSITIDDVVCTADEPTGTVWRYLPLTPSPSVDTAGAPLTSLIEAGEHGFLQVSAQLDPPARRLEALRTVLAKRLGVASVQLRSAIEQRLAVRLIAADQVTATALSSGYAPHTAALNAAVSGDELTAARAALAGERGQLAIEFEHHSPIGAGNADHPVLACADLSDWLHPSSIKDYPC